MLEKGRRSQIVALIEVEEASLDFVIIVAFVIVVAKLVDADEVVGEVLVGQAPRIALRTGDDIDVLCAEQLGYGSVDFANDEDANADLIKGGCDFVIIDARARHILAVHDDAVVDGVTHVAFAILVTRCNVKPLACDSDPHVFSLRFSPSRLRTNMHANKENALLTIRICAP